MQEKGKTIHPITPPQIVNILFILQNQTFSMDNGILKLTHLMGSISLNPNLLPFISTSKNKISSLIDGKPEVRQSVRFFTGQFASG